MSGLSKDTGVVKVSPERMSSKSSLRRALLGPHTPTMYAKLCLIHLQCMQNCVCVCFKHPQHMQNCVSHTHEVCRILCVFHTPARYAELCVFQTPTKYAEFYECVFHTPARYVEFYVCVWSILFKCASRGGNRNGHLGSAAGLCRKPLGQVVSTPHGEANFKGISGKLGNEVSQCLIHITKS